MLRNGSLRFVHPFPLWSTFLREPCTVNSEELPAISGFNLAEIRLRDFYSSKMYYLLYVSRRICYK